MYGHGHLPPFVFESNRVTGTMVAHSSSVQVITRSTLSPPLDMHVGKWPIVCWPPRGQHVYHQKWISGNAHYIRVCKKVNKSEPTQALKPRGYVTRNPKQRYQCPPKDHCTPLYANFLFKKVCRKLYSDKWLYEQFDYFKIDL